MQSRSLLSRETVSPRAQSARPTALTLATLCAGVLIAQLDTSVVNLAVRPIGAYFRAPVGALQWVVDGYNLLYAVLLLTGGLMADLYGRRRIFMVGAAIFAAASLLCAVAPSISILIAGRALAGVGAALLLPASLAIIRVLWPDETARAKALGVWAACNGLAFAIGPTLGGFLIKGFGWRSIFLVVVPVALAALALSPLSIPESSDPGRRSFDAAAQILGALALGAFALAAIESHESPLGAAAAFCVFVASLAAFLKVEARKGAQALVPLDLFGVGAFRGAVFGAAGMTFGMYGAIFLLPLTWQNAARFGPVGAGVALMPMALVFAAVSSFSGGLTKKFGMRFATGGGVAIIGLGLLTIAATAGAASIWPAEIGLVLTGLGMGCATGPLNGAAVSAVAAARAGTAAALINVARMVGATTGVAVLGAAFAFMHGDAPGLRLAMLLGGFVQLSGAAAAWRAMRPTKAPPGRSA